MARCDAQWLPTHVGDPVDAAGAGHVRAAQDVAPAVRRSVLRRDRHRCRVPGCTHATFVDVHHLRAPADGGSHDAENLLTLCGAHHRALHEGTLVITGSLALGLEFRHADGTPYGSPPSAPHALLQARAFQALRGLGFGEREARQALSRAADELAPDAELETVVRHCLELLTARALSRSA